MKAETTWRQSPNVEPYIISYGWMWRDQIEGDCKMLDEQVGIVWKSQGLDLGNIYVVR